MPPTADASSVDFWYILQLLRQLWDLYKHWHSKVLQNVLHYGVEYGVIPQSIARHPTLVNWGLTFVSTSSYLPMLLVVALLYGASNVYKQMRTQPQPRPSGKAKAG